MKSQLKKHLTLDMKITTMIHPYTASHPDTVIPSPMS
jgi:hypothetical protein